MADTNWQGRIPDAVGIFERRLKFFLLRLPTIRVLRYKGNLVWRRENKPRMFHVFGWTDKLYEFRRVNGMPAVRKVI